VARIWKTFEVDVTIRRTDAISESLGAWLRDVLQTASAGPVEVETNLGGLDEAGSPSPDFDWVGMVAAEFPAIDLRIFYRTPTDRREAVSPYEVRVRSRDLQRRAWIQGTGPGRWAVWEE
jgi:hypothetical protein